MRPMYTFQDFVAWAGGTRKAARLLGTSPARISRVKTGLRELDVKLARECEQASGGLYLAAEMLNLTPARPRVTLDAAA